MDGPRNSKKYLNTSTKKASNIFLISYYIKTMSPLGHFKSKWESLELKYIRHCRFAVGITYVIFTVACNFYE